MLWTKSWLETRWRFLIGLALLICSAAAAVFSYPKVLQLLPLVPAHGNGEMGRRLREAAEVVREYRGYIWSQWFRQNLLQMWTIFAVLLGTGGLTPASGSGALFTLSMPVSRHRMIGVRVATGLMELLVLAIVPSLFISLLSPAIGQSYGIGNALIHGASMFIAGSVFFSLASLLSTAFGDIWRPFLIALVVAVVIGSFEKVLPYGIFHVMAGASYFRSGSLPWAALLAAAVLSAAMLYGAAMNIARRDF